MYKVSNDASTEMKPERINRSSQTARPKLRTVNMQVNRSKNACTTSSSQTDVSSAHYRENEIKETQDKNSLRRVLQIFKFK